MCEECDKDDIGTCDCGFCLGGCDPDGFGGDEYAPEENPFDRFDDADDPDLDCDCDLCEAQEAAIMADLESGMSGMSDAPSPDDLEPSPFGVFADRSCEDISDEECESYGESCTGCPGLDSTDSTEAPTAPVLVTQLQGQDVLTVFRFGTGEEKKNAFATMFDAIFNSLDFDHDKLPAAVREVIAQAACTEDADDIRNAMYALITVYPFYVVYPA